MRSRRILVTTRPHTNCRGKDNCKHGNHDEHLWRIMVGDNKIIPPETRIKSAPPMLQQDGGDGESGSKKKKRRRSMSAAAAAREEADATVAFLLGHREGYKGLHEGLFREFLSFFGGDRL